MEFNGDSKSAISQILYQRPGSFDIEMCSSEMYARMD